MKKFALLMAAVTSAASFPALAGPNWNIIHDERRDTMLQEKHCSARNRMSHKASSTQEKHKPVLSSDQSRSSHS